MQPGTGGPYSRTARRRHVARYGKYTHVTATGRGRACPGLARAIVPGRREPRTLSVAAMMA